MLYVGGAAGKMISQLCIFGLMLIASVVAVGLMKRRNMWKWIIAYWLLLTVKNIIDFVGGITNL